MTYPLDCHEDFHKETELGFICFGGKALLGGYRALKRMTKKAHSCGLWHDCSACCEDLHRLRDCHRPTIEPVLLQSIKKQALMVMIRKISGTEAG